MLQASELLEHKAEFPHSFFLDENRHYKIKLASRFAEAFSHHFLLF